MFQRGAFAGEFPNMVFGGITRELHNHVDGLSRFRVLQFWRQLRPCER